VRTISAEGSILRDKALMFNVFASDKWPLCDNAHQKLQKQGIAVGKLEVLKMS
jgi:hypothetical protein